MTPTTPSAQQFDEVSPYAVFQPCDSPKYAGSYNKDFGYKGQVFSPKYNRAPKTCPKKPGKSLTALSASANTIK